MAKLRLEKPYFYSKDSERFGQVLSDDTKRIVYKIIRSTANIESRNFYFLKGPHNRTLESFYGIYPDAKFLTEQEYLFEILKHD